MKRLLSVVEAAELLGLRPGTVRSWLLRRKLPKVACGRAVRVPLEAIERFIEEHTVPAKQDPK